MNQRSLLVASASFALLAGCTIGDESSATRVPAQDVPFQLAATTTSEASGAVDVQADHVLSVFLVRDDRLATVTRVAPRADPPTVLSLLGNGPSDAETADGLRTALVPELAEIVRIERDVITIDLDAEFSALAPTEQRLALAQVTFSMTQLTEVNTVRFLVAGQPASVPRGDGSSTDGPVGPDDYADFAPP